MVRTYSVKYKSKSKMLTDAEKVEAAKKAILDETVAKSVEIKDDGQIVSIEAEEEKLMISQRFHISLHLI